MAQAINMTAASKGSIYFPGNHSWGYLSIPTNVADGQNVVIGSTTFQVDIINTDSTDDTANSDFANTTNPLTVDLTTYTALDPLAVVGALVRIENEIMKVTAKTGHIATFARGRCGTTAASHADASDIYVSDANPAGVVPVGLVSTLTPTAYIPALVQEINALALGWTATANSTLGVFLKSDVIGASSIATTETMAGANNAWIQGTTTVAGKAPGIKQVFFTSYVPSAADVALDYLYIPLPFTPSYFNVDVRVTSSGIPKAWVGGVTYEAGPPKRLKITNEGAVDWAATDTLWIMACE